MPGPEATTRKNITLPDAMWVQINDARREAAGQIPSESEMIRILLREALAARARNQP
jgi:hypothetical protein